MLFITRASSRQNKTVILQISLVNSKNSTHTIAFRLLVLVCKTRENLKRSSKAELHLFMETNVILWFLYREKFSFPTTVFDIAKVLFTKQVWSIV